MKLTLTSSLCRLIVCASAVCSAVEAIGEEFPLAGYAQPQAYPTYQSQTAYQTSRQRSAAIDVLENTVGYAVAAPFGPLLRFDGQFGDGIGFDGNSYSIGAFLPWHVQPGTSLLFSSITGSVTESGDGIFNVGAGHRVYIEELNRIITLAGFFDVDDTHRDTYLRAGVSIESIGKYLEWRLNGYQIVSGNSLFIRQGLSGDASFFRANNILLPFFREDEFAYSGVDVEVGGPLPFLGRYGLSGYVGPYYLWSDDDQDVLGVQARFQAELTDDVAVSTRVSNDGIFGVNAWVNVTLTLPDGKPSRVLQPSSVRERLSADVVRQNRIPVRFRRQTTAVTAINPLDGMPFFVIHTDPNAAAAGTGTFEMPFNMLQAAQAANAPPIDIFRVLPRIDGTGTRLAVNTPFTLLNNQRLLGSSFTHAFTAVRGLFTLPGFTGTGAGPLVTNALGGNVIQLANNNEVSGLIVDGGMTGNGIVGNLNGFNINRNTIRNVVNGIRLLNAQGIGLIDSNTITGATADGVLITVTNNNPLALTVNSNTINGSGDDAFDVMTIGSTLTAMFTDNTFGGSADDGLTAMSTGNSTVNLTLLRNFLGTGNGLAGNGGDGLDFMADSGTANVVLGGPNTADGNIFGGNGDAGVDFNLTGTATASVLAQNNTFGGGVVPGLNFTGSVLGGPNSTGIPPDTMGGVGPNQVVEFINTKFTVFDKITGNQVQTSSLDQFFVDAGVAGATGLFDPRIIYDPSTNRWFASAIDGGTGNNIFVAVSNTSDPTQGWIGFQFQADTTGLRFNDFDTLGLDADGIYLATNNFGGPGGFDISIYSIPKADLLAATPTIANLTRFENLNASVLGSSLQPVVDFGPSNGRATLLASDINSASPSELNRTDIMGTGAAGATLSATTDIAVPTYTAAPNARQPGVNDNIENVSPRINGNVVKLGDSLWAVHAVRDPATGNSAIRYYEIDETTNAVLQTGLITDPNLDFYDASIAANAAGAVVIGFSGSGDSQFISSFATVGQTAGGVTTFAAPTILKSGVAEYFVDFGSGRNRWGDYSATVVDPSDANSFWTFQEYVSATNTWAVQITQLHVVPGSSNLGDGMRIALSGNSFLQGTTIDSNLFLDNRASGLNLTATGNSLAQNVIVTNNRIINNSINGARFDAMGGATINLGNFSGNNVTNSGLDNLLIRAQGAGTLITGGIGRAGLAQNTFIGAQAGAGISLSSTGGATIGGGVGAPFMIDNNVIGGSITNSNFGVQIVADGDSTTLGNTFNVNINNNTITSNSVTNNIGIAAVFSNSGVGADGFNPGLGISNTTVFNSGSTGISLVTNNNTVLNANPPAGFQIWSNNVVFGNGSVVTSPGFRLETNNTSTANVHVSGSQFNNNFGSGIDLVSNDMSTIRFRMNPSISTGNGINGLAATLNNASTATLNIDQSTFMSNLSNGLILTTNNTSTATLNIDRSTFTNNAASGLIYDLNTTTTIATNVTNSSFLNHTAGNGILIDADGTGLAAQFTGTFDNITVTGNGLSGFSADLQGLMGTRANGNPSSIALTNSVFNTNGREGVLLQTQTNRQDRTVDFLNTGGVVVAVDPDPGVSAPFAALGATYLVDGGNGQYLNLLTVLDVDFTATDNQVRGNGTAGVAANDDGMGIIIGTGSNVRVDIERNQFGGGNAGVDLRVASTAPVNGNTPATVVGDFDMDTVTDDQRLTLDDTAQGDFIFLNNTSNDNTILVDLQAAGNAFFTNADAGKAFAGVFNSAAVMGAPDASANRPAFLFQVNSSGTLDATNTFFTGGILSDIDDLFTTGRFNLRATAGFDATFAGNQPVPQPVP